MTGVWLSQILGGLLVTSIILGFIAWYNKSPVLTPEKMKKGRPDLCVMHPLPRVNEISVAMDDDPRACYFKQVLNGKYMRMALILKLLKEAAQ